jgi:hypothetical protein
MTMRTAIIPKQYQVFLEPLPCRHCGSLDHTILRLFPVDPITGRCADLSADGMPTGPWAWHCNFEFSGDTAKFRAAKEAPPPGGREVINAKCLDLDIRWAEWLRCEANFLRPVRFPIRGRGMELL